MKKIYIKLFMTSVALILSISVVAMSSYAWLVLSESPSVSRIQVTIGGGNTILLAPDVSKVVDGVTYHYPGRFTDDLNFAMFEQYNYLRDLGGLTPVSTADGFHWYLPSYYSTVDREVQLGQIPSGQIKDVSDFLVDEELFHANLKATESELISEGSYIYLDFWVVSPGSEYTLRISTGDDSAGSFLIDLMEPRLRGDGGTDFYLADPRGDGSVTTAASCARVGFLAGTDWVTDASMEYYQDSHTYDSRYTRLKGNYTEKDGMKVYGNYRFTIYEPNADSHPAVSAMDGSYVVTNPIGNVGGEPTEVDVSSRLTVQLTNRWVQAHIGAGTELEQRFQAAMLGMDLTGMTEAEVAQSFYGKYLQGQIAPYVQTGWFLKNTSDLYKFNGIVTAEQLAQLETSGATEDVYIIELERNVPQRIRMFIWLEGQDMDCADGVYASTFALNIELAGSNED